MRDPETEMPEGGLRRDRRGSVAAKALPAAPPVPSNHAAPSSRSRGGLFVIAGIAVMVLGVASIAGGMLPVGGSESGGASQIEAASAHHPADDLIVAPCAVFASAETGGSFTHRGDCDAEDVAAQSREISPGTTPAPVPSGAPVMPEDTKSETTPESSPAPGSPAPEALAPATAPNTTPTQPSAPAPPAPPAVQALAFTGISEKYAIGLLGLKVLSSYTLSVSGQPGSIATITYGSVRAGSVTFDNGGRASLTLGGSLLGISNPIVRAAYSDGTAGAAIQAPRNSI